jgi:hypothetical protein
MKIEIVIENGQSLKLRQMCPKVDVSHQLPHPQHQPNCKQTTPSRQVIPGKGGSGQRGRGCGIDKRGEAGGVPSPGEQHQLHSSNLTHSPPPLFRSPWRGINTSPYSCTTVLHSTPKTKPQTLGFGILVQIPPPPWANTPHPCHLHVTNSHPPPPSITPRCRLTRHPQNQASNAWFRLSGPNPTPHLAH